MGDLVLPTGGFRIVVSETVKAYIDAEIRDNFRIRQFWDDVLERVKVTALDESEELVSERVPMFTFIADGAPEFQIPTIQLVFEIFDDTLTVTSALVYQEADYEEGAY